MNSWQRMIGRGDRRRLGAAFAVVAALALLGAARPVWSQAAAPTEATPADAALGGATSVDAPAGQPPSGAAAPDGVDPPAGAAPDVPAPVVEIARQIDESQQAQRVSAGILQPIYEFAELLAFPAFHWAAFALMATGVVSFALQLVLGKLIVLTQLGFSLKEILSDVLGLAISLIGLVLTTQAAAENSTFTASPAAVLSASAVGAVAGFVFYLWGQQQELQAARGRTTAPKK